MLIPYEVAVAATAAVGLDTAVSGVYGISAHSNSIRIACHKKRV
jgi:hypothetical protein